jgi:hypothetical protein
LPDKLAYFHCQDWTDLLKVHSSTAAIELESAAAAAAAVASGIANISDVCTRVFA